MSIAMNLSLVFILQQSEYDIAVIETQARRPVSVKVKQFSLQGARIQNDWQGPQMVKYKNKLHPWKYIVVLPVARNPIKISSPNLTQLKPVHDGIRRVLLSQQRDRGAAPSRGGDGYGGGDSYRNGEDPYAQGPPQDPYAQGPPQDPYAQSPARDPYAQPPPERYAQPPPQQQAPPQHYPPQQQYGAPPPQQYGAPPPQQYGAPPPQQQMIPYGAPPPQQYPPQQPQYGAPPPQQQWGAPPPQQYGY
jgi:hypothetical protein